MRFALFLLALILIGGAGFYVWKHPELAQKVGIAAPAHDAAPAQGAAEASAAPGGGAAGRRGPQAIPVLTAAAQRRDVPVFLDSIGTVQASATVTIHAMIDGPLTEVNFREGQDVHAGDVLARIDPRPYQAALDQATAKKAQDEANLANARLDLARYQKLVAGNYTSAQQADTQKSTVAQLEAQVRQDQAQIDSARTQLSYTTIVSPIDGRTGIRQVDMGNLVHPTDTNGIVVITTLKPISVVFNLPQQALQAVTAAMARNDALVLAYGQAVGGSTAARGTPSSANAANNAAANAASATSLADAGQDEAASTSSGPPLDRGTLTVLDNEVDPNTGTIKLKASFPNAKLALWPGGFVNIRLRVQTLPQMVTVPPAAVQRGPSGAFVYVVDEGNLAKRVSVDVGYEDARLSVVTSGLDPGTRVVTDGASRLSDGARVSVSAPDDGVAPAAAPRRQRRDGGGGEPGASGRRPQNGSGAAAPAGAAPAGAAQAGAAQGAG